MSAKSRQRGVAAVVFLAIFAMILIGVLTTGFGGRSIQNEFDAKTFPVLAAAKEALIAYAASHPTAPGRLPCPDTQNDGLEHCSGVVTDQLGRLPWKTLGIPIPRDGSGECLWYAVSGNFVATPLTPGINSDANGTIKVVDDASPANVLAGATVKSLAVAVIFAPGSPFETNNRTPPAPSQCGGNSIASNYLDLAGGVNNATVSVPAQYVAGTPGPIFNDRLVYITPADLFPSVERRVAGEIKKRLQTYFALNHYYPFASAILDTSFACTPTITRGRLPVTIAASCTGLAEWPATPPDALPAWYQNDHWDMLTFYSVAPSCASPNISCTPAGALLTLLKGPVPVTNKQAVVIEAGRALPTQDRSINTIDNYLDAPDNIDDNDTYVTLPRSPTFNDVVVVVAP